MRPRRLAVVLAAAAAAAVACAPPALAGGTIIARGARQISLKVDRHGVALVTFEQKGAWHHVLAWGAINAKFPAHGATSPQAKFHYDFAGGYGMGKPGYWKTVRSVCRPYDGPHLHWVVAACRAPDGSYWALQNWRRALPDAGRTPTALQAAPELHLSHWRGPLPRFWIKMDWQYCGAAPGGGCFDHLFGELTYRFPGVGLRGMYGFKKSPQGAPLDAFGTLVFLDTHDSGYGRGWKRYNSWLTHNPHGAVQADGHPYVGGDFCAGLYAHFLGVDKYARGDRYRATVNTPGVLPALYWEGPPPGPYRAGTLELFGSHRTAFDSAVDQALNQEQISLAYPDDNCRNPH